MHEPEISKIILIAVDSIIIISTAVYISANGKKIFKLAELVLRLYSLSKDCGTCST